MVLLTYQTVFQLRLNLGHLQKRMLAGTKSSPVAAVLRPRRRAKGKGNVAP
jgi:hypothetical protein